jgi:hypothetical protein
LTNVNALQEVRLAIAALSAEDRCELVKELPVLFPEWEGDLSWQAIIHDPTPSPALSALVDEVDRQFQVAPESFPELTEAEFDKRS